MRTDARHRAEPERDAPFDVEGRRPGLLGALRRQAEPRAFAGVHRLPARFGGPSLRFINLRSAGNRETRLKHRRPGRPQAKAKTRKPSPAG